MGEIARTLILLTSVGSPFLGVHIAPNLATLSLTVCECSVFACPLRGRRRRRRARAVKLGCCKLRVGRSACDSDSELVNSLPRIDTQRKIERTRGKGRGETAVTAALVVCGNK